MNYKVKIEILLCILVLSILVLSILNGVILCKFILFGHDISLLHCIITSFILGLLYHISFLKIYSKYNLLKETNKILTKELKTDKLTKLLNRGTFNNDIQNVTDNERFSAIFIDIDNFRAFNNGHGHAIGDKVLKDV